VEPIGGQQPGGRGGLARGDVEVDADGVAQPLRRWRVEVRAPRLQPV
jgi:hypothetical protein